MKAAIRRAVAWHPALMTVAAVMVLCAVVSAVGLLVDPRTVLGGPLWAKPLKFSVSILLYAVTWAWLIAHLPRWRRLAHRLGTVIAVTLLVEQALILWAAATGTTSHFNVSSPLHVVVWGVMAVSITVLYLCTFVTSAALFFLRLPTPALTVAVRLGAVIALGGIGVAFLMTGPTPTQLTSPDGIVGAHAVGVVDGGPGVPVLGWSTTGGDYRVAHFVGMHALQLVPLVALALTVLARRVPRLRSDTTQVRIVVIVALAYACGTVLLTLQAVAGQSVVHPSAAVSAVAGAILLAASAATVLTLLRRPAPVLRMT
ncbi:hypothetical protein DEI97_008195 [Curtobacterium sp. MCLR17_032]|uniref:hypothetical protein n=1 Tax=Curtobacterium sp. MCLR17_032 TaxID=2175650 RepID=UPI0021AD16BD|nr:hypothetical protein [Curtobacterium sp. MCLR17_032]WIE63110.1 hypothetical protein DEI97_008195 [Curtobacterium sp. MCLR17_032]